MARRGVRSLVLLTSTALAFAGCGSRRSERALMAPPRSTALASGPGDGATGGSVPTLAPGSDASSTSKAGARVPGLAAPSSAVAPSNAVGATGTGTAAEIKGSARSRYGQATASSPSSPGATATPKAGVPAPGAPAAPEAPQPARSIPGGPKGTLRVAPNGTLSGPIGSMFISGYRAF